MHDSKIVDSTVYKAVHNNIDVYMADCFGIFIYTDKTAQLNTKFT